MNHQEFGHLVATLRKEHRELDQAGNMLSWTQHQLARRANLSKEIIANIEGGRKKSLSPAVLLNLARALNLTSEERAEFFSAANGIDDDQRIRCVSSPQDTLNHILHTLEQTYLPAFVIDTYCDVLAANQAVLNIFHVTERDAAYIARHPIGTNMLTFVFSPQLNMQSVMEPHFWENYAYTNMMFFRTTTLRYRTTSYFKRLLSELRQWKLFRRYWEEVSYEERDYVVNTEHIHINNPVLGPLQFYSALYKTMTSHGYLSLFVYVPADSTTMQVFCEQAQQEGGTNVFRFGSWPKMD
jgi:transcriptional regulator with XRE-family HTH domain